MWALSKTKNAGKGQEKCVLKMLHSTVSRHLPFFLVKVIGQWILGDHGGWMTRDKCFIHLYFQPSTKNVYKVGTLCKFILTLSSIFCFVKCPNYVLFFCRGLKMRVIFLNISSFPATIVFQDSLTNDYNQKKSRTRETLNLSTDADSSTNTIDFFSSDFFGGVPFFWGGGTNFFGGFG